jgi:hypothetical protein
MAILSNSWAQHFRSITVNNNINKNMRAFTNAFASTTTLAKRVNTVAKEVNLVVFLVKMSGTVLQMHSWLKFGGMRSCPNFIIVSLIGMGPRASAVIINHGTAVAFLTITLPAVTMTANCKLIGELVALASGGLATGGTMAPQTTTVSTTTGSMAPQATTTAGPMAGTTPASGTMVLQATTASLATDSTVPQATTKAGLTVGTTPAPGRNSRWGPTTTRTPVAAAGTTPPTSAAGWMAPPTVVAAGAVNAAGTATASTVTVLNTTVAAAVAATTITTTTAAIQPVTTQTLMLTLAFIPAPFLHDTLFNEGTTDPLELFIKACKVATDFQNCHQGVVGFRNTSAHNHADAFTNWAFAIKLGLLGKVRYSIDPENEELLDFTVRRHENCVLPPVKGGTINGMSISNSPGNTTAVFKNLSEGLKHIGKAANKTNILKKEEMRLKGEAHALIKNRIKDMHSSISNMILMASATKSDKIGTFSNSFKLFYNSKNQGYADMELHHQFNTKDLQNVGFATGTALPLWSGLLKRSNPTAPSNCTPFAFRELQPMNMNQKSQSLICTMINQKGGLA